MTSPAPMTALRELYRAARDVHQFSANNGRQWDTLKVALLLAEAALTNDARAKRG